MIFETFFRFSVDFSAHISYHYLDSEGGPDDRVKSSLYGLGLPIIQGAISTILGVIGQHQRHLFQRQATRHDCLPSLLDDGDKRSELVSSKEKNIL
jgi:hypothetical protein